MDQRDHSRYQNLGPLHTIPSMRRDRPGRDSLIRFPPSPTSPEFYALSGLQRSHDTSVMISGSKHLQIRQQPSALLKDSQYSRNEESPIEDVLENTTRKRKSSGSPKPSSSDKHKNDERARRRDHQILMDLTYEAIPDWWRSLCNETAPKICQSKINTREEPARNVVLFYNVAWQNYQKFHDRDIIDVILGAEIIRTTCKVYEESQHRYPRNPKRKHATPRVHVKDRARPPDSTQDCPKSTS